MLLPVASEAQVMSFEDMSALHAWKSDKSSVGISTYRYKFGQSSLMIRWQPGAVVTLAKWALANPQIETNTAVNVWARYEHELWMRRRCWIKRIR